MAGGSLSVLWKSHGHLWWVLSNSCLALCYCCWLCSPSLVYYSLLCGYLVVRFVCWYLPITSSAVCLLPSPSVVLPWGILTTLLPFVPVLSSFMPPFPTSWYYFSFRLCFWYFVGDLLDPWLISAVLLLIFFIHSDNNVLCFVIVIVPFLYLTIPI